MTKYNTDVLSLPPPRKPIWKSPEMPGGLLIGNRTGIVPPAIDHYSARPVTAVAADDLLASGFTALQGVRQQHCETIVKQLKPGDTLINLGLADKPEVIG